MPATILIIEDDDDFRIELQAMVTSLGYGVALPGDIGDKVVRGAVKGGGYDLVIVNVSMRRTDGLQVIGLMRSAGPKRPVIAIAGSTAEISAALCLKLAESYGADGILYKPFSSSELGSLIVSLLRC